MLTPSLKRSLMKCVINDDDDVKVSQAGACPSAIARHANKLDHQCAIAYKDRMASTPWSPA
jgi:hypothetical protein